MGKWHHEKFDDTLNHKFRRLFDAVNEKGKREEGDNILTFDQFADMLDVNDKCVRKLFEIIIKETAQKQKRGRQSSQAPYPSSNTSSSYHRLRSRANHVSASTMPLLQTLATVAVANGGELVLDNSTGDNARGVGDIDIMIDAWPMSSRAGGANDGFARPFSPFPDIGGGGGGATASEETPPYSPPTHAAHSSGGDRLSDRLFERLAARRGPLRGLLGAGGLDGGSGLGRDTERSLADRRGVRMAPGFERSILLNNNGGGRRRRPSSSANLSNAGLLPEISVRTGGDMAFLPPISQRVEHRGNERERLEAEGREQEGVGDEGLSLGLQIFSPLAEYGLMDNSL
ncbi:uncharacterized protein VTP21DRAFT_1602 [Calcarisporiella thermophila]|uniref:uncharacterized protein n=1 Tax=Calcarisporiella thermophila TaxID=911321 RepID=UPI003742AC5E